MFKYPTSFITVLFYSLSIVVSLTLSLPAMESHHAPNPTSDQISAYEMFCKDYSHLQLCKLEFTLQQALAELQYIILNDDPIDDSENFKTKRKSAFVRFGKRSNDDDMLFDKRKSAFVRFGRSVEDPINGQKRKSSYVRFG